MNTAYIIFNAVVHFLSRLSARYSRVLTPHIADLAGQLQAHTEQANAIYPSSPQRRELRRAHLLEARGSLMALDAALSAAYRILLKNPQGAYANDKKNGKTIAPEKAARRLNALAYGLGNLIDKENGLLKGVIESTK